MKTKCPFGCGKIFVTAEHAKKHVEQEHTIPAWKKQYGWKTPYGFIDFTHPVTYEEACERMKEASEKLWPKEIEQ